MVEENIHTHTPRKEGAYPSGNHVWGMLTRPKVSDLLGDGLKLSYYKLYACLNETWKQWQGGRKTNIRYPVRAFYLLRVIQK